jgi:glycosyltransferase involved in cell wall biosynthesis
VGTAGRPRLLFIAPAMPSDVGNGLALRGGVFLDAYAADHDVDLVVLPLAGSAAPTAFAAARCARIEVVPLADVADPHAALIERLVDPAEQVAAWARFPRPSICRYSPVAARRILAERLGTVRYDLVHVQRAYMAPLVEPLLDRPDRPAALLDLDDDDATTGARRASLHRRRGEPLAASLAEADAAKFATLAARHLPSFERVLTCSALDRERLAGRYPGSRFAVIPNATPPAGELPTARRGTALLMVGNMTYLPNRDGAEWLIGEVLPLLGPVDLTLVGACDPELRDLAAATPGVTATGPVPDTGPYYAGAQAAVVPLRAGGGTRIKILEAFARRVPVIATSLGAEDLELTDERHLLLADTPEGFAARCRRVLSDAALRDRLTTAAAAWLDQHGTREVARACIRRLVGELRGSAPAASYLA